MHPLRDPAPRLHALVPCAGTGSRAGTAQPKQYQPLDGQPMVMHTLAALAKVTRLDSLLIAVSPDDRYIDAMNPPATVVACGGATRAATVMQGLQALQAAGAHDDDWVLVHDAARCLVTAHDVDRLIDACIDDAVGGLLATPLADTLKQVQANTPSGAARAAQTLSRADKWLAQTPQMFRIGLLARALAQAGDQVTDEASAIEALGLQPLLVRASAHNFKVTYPEDFALAEALLRSRTP